MTVKSRIPIEKINRKFLKEKEDAAFSIVNILRYSGSQLFEEIKALVSYLTFYFLNKKDKDLLLQIRRKGFVILKEYDLGENIDVIDLNCNKAKMLVKDTLDLPGSRRYKRVEKYNSIINDITNNRYFKKLNFFYTFRNKNSVAMLSETTAIDQGGRTISEGDYFADYPHFDLYIRQLKVAIALTDIKDENGPTEFIPYSSMYNFKVFKSYFSSWLSLKKIVKGGKPFLPDGFYKSLKEKSGFELLTMDKGDILIFDSRNFHRATHLRNDSRKILWLYY